MSAITKAYEPSEVEAACYEKWVAAGCFRGEPDSGHEPFSIVIPPPNVTGVLHMGHLLNNTVQDILVRRARLQDKAAVWLPGTDHAGIATQSRVERELREEGLSRHDLGREAFVKRAEAWRDEHGGIILEQLQKLGCSCDWDRNVHTLDDDYSRSVLTAFVLLYERGYLYRGRRMVNWCPVSLTALSDEEVNMKPQRGKLYHVQYEVVEEPGRFVEIATTRPETIMGDTAVAVHPEDARYRDLQGKHVWRPFPREPIPVVADEAVDREFGTGVLKVTPAHDALDWEIGQRHGLEPIDVFDPNGTVNEKGDRFAGMDRFVARKAAAEALREMGLMVREEDYENNVGFSERADVPIEPRLSEQWFLRYPKVEEAIRAVEEGLICIYPKRWEKTYLHWLRNIRDWTVSRQLWWGHRIPVWYRKGADRNDPANQHVSVDGPPDPENWDQEEDVLDTWASSWLWPFATFGWPDDEASKRRGLDHFYPTSVLVTGFDILFFWVARMIIAGLEFMGEARDNLDSAEIARRIPFRDVYITGLIRDIQGRKMSKSLGNSPDALELLKKYGADGVRLGLVSIAPKGLDILFAEERLEPGRNFCNKLWNVCRFRQMSGEAEDNTSGQAILERINPAALDSDDRAILGRLCQTWEAVERDFAAYELNRITQHLYRFFWTDYCDWYVEVSKARVQDDTSRQTVLAVQDLVLRELLLMLHPFIPFITEELWSRMGFGVNGGFLQESRPFLKAALDRMGISADEPAVAEVEALRESVTLVRSLKAEFNLAAKRDVALMVEADARSWARVESHRGKLMALLGAAALERVEAPPDGCPAAVTPSGIFYLNLAESLDVEAEKLRLQKDADKLEQLVRAGEAKLRNANFTGKAPAQVVQGARDQLAENQGKLNEIRKLLAAL